MRPALQPFVDELLQRIPTGTEVIDVHAHLGADEDGRALLPPRLLRQMDASGVARACVFPLHDPERRPAYRVPNDRVLEWAADAPERFIPFCRVDPADGPVAELDRCLARGARGVKLHPRAQTFAFDGGAADGIFARAAEARVPILVHAGRGMPPIADGLCDVALRHPDAPLILAHAAIADQAVFAHRLADHPRALFDTSVFGPVDLMELLARVPVERIVFGSDPPYGRVLLGLYLTVRAMVAGGANHAQLTGVLGATTAAVLDGRELATPTAPLRPRTLLLPGPVARITNYLSAAFSSILRGDTVATRESVELARSVCRDPQPGPCEPTLDRIGSILATVDDEADGGSGLPTADVLYLAMSLAVTEPVR